MDNHEKFIRVVQGFLAVIATLVLIAVIVSACTDGSIAVDSVSGASTELPYTPQLEREVSEYVHRVVDPETGVVCYLFRDSDWVITDTAYGGISCVGPNQLPDNWDGE